MVNVIQVGDRYNIIFPYDQTLIGIIKNVPTRQYDPAKKSWSVHKDKLGWFLNEVKGTVYEHQVRVYSNESINENETIDSTTVIPNIDISRIPYYVKEGATPYAHQLDFMRFAIDRQQRGQMGGFIVADDMGLAKTNESMNLAIYNHKQYRFTHCLIICCINSSKYNWKEDIQLHTRGEYEAYILGTRWKRGKKGHRFDTGGVEKLQDLETGHMYGKEDEPELPYFLIMNIEALRYRVGKKFPICEKLIQMVNSGEIQMCVIDEVHKNVSPSSQQGKQLIKLKEKTPAGALMFLPMTGTPITSRPTDVYLPLKLVDGHTFTDYYHWCLQFCIYGGYGDHEIIGYKNIPYLKNMLQSFMIRRTKDKVLDLPPKIHYTEYVENTKYQQKLYEQLQDEIRRDKEKHVRELNGLSAFLKLRQINGSPELVDTDCKIDGDYLKKNAKLKRLLELLEDAHERGEKTLVFSNWVEPLRTLYRFISKRYKVCCYTGTMKADEREKHKRVFQNNPEYTVMIGTIGAMGTSHTLTAASNIIFYDEPWVPTDKEQASDRAYRIGTKDSLKIFTLISQGTVDDVVHNILYTKDTMAKYIVDGVIDIRGNPELFDMLLGDRLPLETM